MKKVTKSVLMFVTILNLCGSLSFVTLIKAKAVDINENSNGDLQINKNGDLDDYSELYGGDNVDVKPLRPIARSRAAVNEVNYIAIMIEFPNRTNYDFSTAIPNAETILNSEDGFDSTVVGGTQKRLPSLKSYIEKYSYGKLDVNAGFFPKDDATNNAITYTLTHDKEYYMPYSSSNIQGYKNVSEQSKRERGLISEVLNATKKQIASNYDAGALDRNHDGIVDAISFFIEGGYALSDKEVNWHDLLWSHKMSQYTGVDINGVHVSTYNMIYSYNHNSAGGMFSLNRSGYGTLIHEFMHTLGLPDLYRYSDMNSNPVGFYDLMAGTKNSDPQGLLSEVNNIYELGWHNPLQTFNASAQGIVIQKPKFKDSSEQQAIKIQSPLKSDEYFVVEYHDDDPIIRPHADGSGIIVYRINTKVYEGNKNGTSDGKNDQIYIYRPGEVQNALGNGRLEEAVLNSTRNTLGKGFGDTVGDFDNESLFYSDGSNSGVKIKVTNQDSDSVVIDIDLPEVQGDGTESNPYMISTADDFQKFLSGTHKKYFKLSNDIDFKNIDNFTTITMMDNYLDGDNHVIKNLNIDGPGIFDSVAENYKISNLILENVIVTNEQFEHTGIVCSKLYGTLENIVIKSGSVSGRMNGGGAELGIGGMVGTMLDDAMIENCGSYANVKQGYITGGLVGLLQGLPIINNSFSMGQVGKGTSLSGGFIGEDMSMGLTTNGCLFGIWKDGPKNAVGEIQDNRIIGVSTGDEIVFVSKDEQAVPITFTPNVEIPYTLTFDNDIVSYQDHKIKPLKNGNTKGHIKIPVGTHTITKDLKIKVALVNDNQDPIISNDKVSNLTKDGYTISFDAKDPDGKITSVKAITYSEAGGKEKQVTKELFSKTENYRLDVSTKSFNGNVGKYITKIVVYDDEGAMTTKTIEVEVLPEQIPRIISSEYHQEKNRYHYQFVVSNECALEEAFFNIFEESSLNLLIKKSNHNLSLNNENNYVISFDLDENILKKGKHYYGELVLKNSIGENFTYIINNLYDEKETEEIVEESKEQKNEKVNKELTVQSNNSEMTQNTNTNNSKKEEGKKQKSETDKDILDKGGKEQSTPNGIIKDEIDTKKSETRPNTNKSTSKNTEKNSKNNDIGAMLIIGTGMLIIVSLILLIYKKRMKTRDSNL